MLGCAFVLYRGCTPDVALLLQSRFSRVRLCVTPETAAPQALPSLGFSKQEHWSGLPFPSPVHESESEAAQSCPTPSDPMDCSLPGFSVHGIFQSSGLDWGAIAFSEMWPSCVQVYSRCASECSRCASECSKCVPCVLQICLDVFQMWPKYIPDVHLTFRCVPHVFQMWSRCV